MYKRQPRAFAAYEVGAEGDDAFSQNQLGAMYDRGHGVAQDYKQARVWYEKAAAQDHPNAICTLGVMYYEGKGVIPSFRRARDYFKRAIQLGEPKAQKNMDHLIRLMQVIVSPKVHVFHSPVHSFVTAYSTTPWWTSEL